VNDHAAWVDTLHSSADGVYRVILNRPAKKNAFTPTMYREVKQAVLAAGNDPLIDVIIVEGTDGIFSSGGDLKTLLDILDLPPDQRLNAFVAAFNETMPFQAMADCPKPIIAKVDGLCLAGGLILAALADATIASTRAEFGVPEGRVGVVDAFCPVLLPASIGLSRARYMMTSGVRIDAATALAWGLVLKVVPLAELEATVQETVAEFKRVSPDSRRLYKRAANRLLPRVNPTVVLDAALTENGREGLAAFRDKRQPQWVPSGDL
jgi:methylglutaconyl-CoA hydratase